MSRASFAPKWRGRGRQAVPEFPPARGGVPGVRETNCSKCYFFKRLRRRNSFPLVCGQQKRIRPWLPCSPTNRHSGAKPAAP
jgi:hypothetical protein